MEFVDVNLHTETPYTKICSERSSDKHPLKHSPKKELGMTQMEKTPSVAEWLEGKDILITGATGFMGKVLVEKLLRCCPGLNRLYLVVRTKRGYDPDERLKDYKKNVLFGILLQKYPDAFDKVTVIPGDMSELECGISEKHQQLPGVGHTAPGSGTADIQYQGGFDLYPPWIVWSCDCTSPGSEILRENVSVVFHIAATVRFDHSLSVALKMNTRGTNELTKIVKQMKKLEVFEYVSTTYCNSNLGKRIEEKVYPSHLDWKTVLNLLDTEEEVLDILLYKLIWTQPNTYTLSKSLAENIILEASQDIPAVIVRPSVVISTMDEPLPGWTDNLNGLAGVTVGCSKGVLRTFKCSPNAVLDFVPVDISINGLVASAWSKRFFNNGKGDLQVFNQAYSDRVPLSFSDILNYGVKVSDILPSENYIWYPFMIITSNTYYYHFLFFFLQFLPALLQDLVLSAVGRKPFLVKLNTKIYNAVMALSDFSENVFRFANENYMSIDKRLSREDQITFDIKLQENIDVSEYVMGFQRGVKRYVFNEKDEDLPRLRRNHRRLYFIDGATKVLFVGFVLWKLVQWASFFFPESKTSSV